MNLRRKKIYLALVASAVVLSAAVLMFGRARTPEVPLNLSTPTPQAGLNFPSDNKFDLSVFESATFKTLKVYTPLSVKEGELGREDPFKPY